MVRPRLFAARHGAPQEARQLRQRQLIHIPLELDDRVERYPILVPTPRIEFRVIGGAQTDVAVAAEHPKQEPDLFLAAVMTAYFALDELVGHLVTQPVARATDDLDVLRTQAGFFV